MYSDLLTIDIIEYKNRSIGVLRLDLIHPEISGNKWYKLKYNLIEAKVQNKNTIITFGGAHSNHIVATACAAHKLGLNSMGFIRKGSTEINTPTLQTALSYGMHIKWLSKDEYSKKETQQWLNQLQTEFPDAYVVPEGGNNALGIKGCKEIFNKNTSTFNQIYCSVGTACTYEGLRQSLMHHQKLIGINVLKNNIQSQYTNAEINNQFHFGGYAVYSKALIEFKKWFELNYNIPLDYIYTNKLFYAVFNLIDLGVISNSDSILIIHSGGLQGNAGFEKRYAF